MQKIILIILSGIILVSGISFFSKKSKEKKAFIEIETLISKTNSCLQERHWECAETNIKVLLNKTPNDTNLQLHLAGILLEQGRYLECLNHIDSLSFASKTADMIKEKASMLLKEQENLQIEDSKNFRLEFDGAPAKTDIYEALTVLEVVYDSLCQLFDFYPKNRIHLVLYQSNEFQGSPNRPEWVGAVFDGKLRISLKTMNHRELYRPMITHELTHAFIHAMGHGTIPLWLNEGIAQTIDGSPLKEKPKGNIPTIKMLTEPFINEKNRENAEKLYWYSHYMVLKMLEKIPFNEIKTLIKTTGEKGIENALSKYDLSPGILLQQ